jgi:hypothetical protein
MTDQPVGRADRAANQFAAAVRAAPAEDSFAALAAKGALERTDPSIERFGRQIPVTAFAVWPEVEHRHPTLWSGSLLHLCIVREKVGIGERLSL